MQDAPNARPTTAEASSSDARMPWHPLVRPDSDGFGDRRNAVKERLDMPHSEYGAEHQADIASNARDPVDYHRTAWAVFGVLYSHNAEDPFVQRATAALAAVVRQAQNENRHAPVVLRELTNSGLEQFCVRLNASNDPMIREAMGWFFGPPKSLIDVRQDRFLASSWNTLVHLATHPDLEHAFVTAAKQLRVITAVQAPLATLEIRATSRKRFTTRTRSNQ
jgi:hypothetical protein